MASSRPRIAMKIRNQRRKVAALMRARTVVPTHMPRNAGMTASADKVMFPRWKAPPRANPAASATVETVNDSPSAWIRSSLERPRAWR